MSTSTSSGEVGIGLACHHHRHHHRFHHYHYHHHRDHRHSSSHTIQVLLILLVSLSTTTKPIIGLEIPSSISSSVLNQGKKNTKNYINDNKTVKDIVDVMTDDTGARTNNDGTMKSKMGMDIERNDIINEDYDFNYDYSNNPTIFGTILRDHEETKKRLLSSSTRKTSSNNNDNDNTNDSMNGNRNVYAESSTLLAFDDIRPRSKLHILIIPKQYIPTIYDLGPTLPSSSSPSSASLNTIQEIYTSKQHRRRQKQEQQEQRDDQKFHSSSYHHSNYDDDDYYYYIRNLQSLTLLEEMKEMAISILKENLPISYYDTNNFRLCFHIPPFNSIDHLHLHVIAPVYDGYGQNNDGKNENNNESKKKSSSSSSLLSSSIPLLTHNKNDDNNNNNNNNNKGPSSNNNENDKNNGTMRPTSLTMIGKYKYWVGTRWCIDIDTIIQRLQTNHDNFEKYFHNNNENNNMNNMNRNDLSAGTGTGTVETTTSRRSKTMSSSSSLPFELLSSVPYPYTATKQMIFLKWSFYMVGSLVVVVGIPTAILLLKN